MCEQIRSNVLQAIRKCRKPFHQPVIQFLSLYLLLLLLFFVLLNFPLFRFESANRSTKYEYTNQSYQLEYVNNGIEGQMINIHTNIVHATIQNRFDKKWMRQRKVYINCIDKYAPLVKYDKQVWSIKKEIMVITAAMWEIETNNTQNNVYCLSARRCTPQYCVNSDGNVDEMIIKYSWFFVCFFLLLILAWHFFKIWNFVILIAKLAIDIAEKHQQWAIASTASGKMTSQLLSWRNSIH